MLIKLKSDFNKKYILNVCYLLILKITGHYGSKVMISKKGSLVSILPSKFDFNRTRGLFGNLNSNPNDEYGPTSNQNEFFDRNK